MNLALPIEAKKSYLIYHDSVLCNQFQRLKLQDKRYSEIYIFITILINS